MPASSGPEDEGRVLGEGEERLGDLVVDRDEMPRAQRKGRVSRSHMIFSTL